MRTPTAIASILLSLTAVRAQSPAAQPEFEVASIKRNVSESRPWLVPPVGGRFTATNVTLRLLIGMAWPIGWPKKILGAPSWAGTEGYDVSAKEPEGNVSRDEFSQMLQNLLKDRFRMSVHTETQEATVFVLTAAKRGLKLPDATPEPCVSGWKPSDPKEACGSMSVTPELIASDKLSMQWFTDVLGSVLGKPVVNKTGFTGSFSIHLEFAPLAPGAAVDSTKPSITSALEELGFKIESQKGTEEVFVIDHVERPSAN